VKWWESLVALLSGGAGRTEDFTFDTWPMPIES